ncbi:MAG: thiol-disulfide isomerase/thioredoxin [Gammaproteobacteria bacterium]|jgi:thiol-disulfide isomerase/thioredoxin
MQQMPYFQRMNEKYGDKINILAININLNEDNKYIKDVIAKFALTMPILLDNKGQLRLLLD